MRAGIIASSRQLAVPAASPSFVLLDHGGRTNGPAAGYCSWDTNAPSRVLWLQQQFLTAAREDADGQPLNDIVAAMASAAPFTMLVDVDGALALTLTNFRWGSFDPPATSVVTRFSWDAPAVTSPWPNGTRITFRPQI